MSPPAGRPRTSSADRLRGAEAYDPTLALRVPAWTLAYTALRTAWLAMARDAQVGTREHEPLAREAERIRRVLERQMIGR